MRVLSAIVLLLWVGCYGRCLAGQYAVNDRAEQSWCAGDCCKEETPEPPAELPASSCGMCEFIKSGALLPGYPLVLDVPDDFCFVDCEFNELGIPAAIANGEEPCVFFVETGQPKVSRLFEWMAGRATPVRGPNLRA